MDIENAEPSVAVLPALDLMPFVLPRSLAREPLEIVRPMGEGSAGAVLVRSPDGDLGVLKPATLQPFDASDIEAAQRRERRIRAFKSAAVPIDGGSRREAAVADIDRALPGVRIVPPAVQRQSQLGPCAVSLFIDGILSWHDASEALTFADAEAFAAGLSFDPRARRMAQIDWVTGQSDRHSKNLSFASDGELRPSLVMIDNELCLGSRSTPSSSGCISRDLSDSQVEDMLTPTEEERLSWRELSKGRLELILRSRMVEEDAIERARARLRRFL